MNVRIRARREGSPAENEDSLIFNNKEKKYKNIKIKKKKKAVVFAADIM